MTATIESSKMYDLQWALRCAELRAKTEWDNMYQAYGKKDKDDLLTEIAYEKVKQLRTAQQTLAKVHSILLNQNQLEYSS